MTLRNKLSSRKFWAFLITTTAVIVFKALGDNVPWELLASGVGYIFGESAKDMVDRWRKG